MLLSILSTCALLVRGALAHASIDYPPCIGMAINGTRFPNARNGSSTLPGDLVLDGLALHNARVAFNFPLNMNGTDYPCKFPNGVSPQFGTDSAGVQEWTAGSTEFFNFTESDNVAAHGGGSCQVSLSFDGGNNFQVIRSYVGGCPANATFNSNDLPPRDQSPQKFEFTIPKDTPNGHAIFAWTWFPISGNISMHMNCAWINISGGTNATNRTRPLNTDDYPPLFVANIQAINTCKGKDSFEVIFPTPGKYATSATGTETAGTYSVISPSGNCTGPPSPVTSTATVTATSRTGSASSTAKATSKTGAAAACLDGQQAWRRSLILVLGFTLIMFL